MVALWCELDPGLLDGTTRVFDVQTIESPRLQHGLGSLLSQVEAIEKARPASCFGPVHAVHRHDKEGYWFMLLPVMIRAVPPLRGALVQDVQRLEAQSVDMHEGSADEQRLRKPIGADVS